MTNAIYLISAFLIYMIILGLLVYKYKDICKYPEKYRNPRLEEAGDELIQRKRHSPFFKSLSHKYGMLLFLIPLILTFLDFLILLILQKTIFINGTQIFLGMMFIGIISLFFLNLTIGLCIIPLMIKTPFFDVALREMFNVYGREKIYKRTYFITTVLFLITFPFAVLSVSNYMYFTNEAIVYSGFFELLENTTKYEQVKQVHVHIHHDNSNRVNAFYYDVILFNNKKVNLNNPNTSGKSLSEKVYVIHKLIEEKGSCDIIIKPLTQVDFEFMSAKLTSREREIVNYIYEGFHR